MPILHVHQDKNQSGMDLLDTMLLYARIGWRVLPLHTIIDGGCTCDEAEKCGAPGKHPLNARGCSDATRHEDTIRNWCKEAPQANIGIATGHHSGVFMIGPDGAAGIKAFDDLARQHQSGPLPATPRSRSGSGEGLHYCFRWPDGGGIKTAANLNGLPIDSRNTGGLFVAPPSLHKSGKRYCWELAPWEVDVAEAPMWLVQWLQSAKGASAKKKLIVQPPARPDATQRAIAYMNACPPAVEKSNGSGQMMSVARGIVWGFDLGVDAGLTLIKDHYNHRCKPPWSDKELLHKCQDANKPPPDGKPRGYLLDGQDDTNTKSSNGQARKEQEAAEPVADDIEAMPMPEPAPWPTLRPEALHGLAGEIVRAIEPETESDPVAILGQLLVAFGSAVGRSPRFAVEGTDHHANLFLALVGESSRGRKGTSRGRVMRLMEQADAAWCQNCVAAGLSSGEGLIWAVRDAVMKREPTKEKGRVVGYQEVEADPGITDKRLYADEGEFAQALNSTDALFQAVRAVAWE